MLFSNHREADQKIPNHILFAISPESSMYVVSDDTDIYILMLYIQQTIVMEICIPDKVHIHQKKVYVSLHKPTSCTSF